MTTRTQPNARITGESLSVDHFTGWSLEGHEYQACADTAAPYRDARAGRFPQNFADHEIDSGRAGALGVERRWLEMLGAKIGDALIGARGSHEKACAGLQRVIEWLVKDATRGENRPAAGYYLQYVCSIQDDIHRRRHSLAACARPAFVFGIVIEALEQARAHGVTPTLRELCKVTARFANASATDTRNAILRFTHDVPLADWLSTDARPRR